MTRIRFPKHGYETPGGLPPTGVPNSYGYDENGIRLPYANHRPDYTEEQIIEVWNNSKKSTDGVEPNPDGSDFHYQAGDVIVQDAEGYWKKVEWEPGQPGPRNWDMGHIDEAKYSTLRDDYLSKNITLEEFLAEYRNSANYRVQDPMRNRTHMDEPGQ